MKVGHSRLRDATILGSEKDAMELPRRRFLQLAAGTEAPTVVSRTAAAKAYPTRPVRLVVGQAAGSGSDTFARLIGQWLSERLGQQFVVDNRPGASGNLATEAVVRAPPDGYTLLFVGSNNFISATMFEKLNFDFIRDIAPIASLRRQPNVMEVTPSFPARTVPEFIAYAKANPGKINFASGGIGTSVHLSGELFKLLNGIEMTHVPYRGFGAGGYADLMTGAVHVALDSMDGSVG